MLIKFLVRYTDSRLYFNKEKDGTEGMICTGNYKILFYCYFGELFLRLWEFCDRLNVNILFWHYAISQTAVTINSNN